MKSIALALVGTLLIAGQSSSNASKPESNGMLKLKRTTQIHGTINGGGVEINIRSFNGSILVHKGK